MDGIDFKLWTLAAGIRNVRCQGLGCWAVVLVGIYGALGCSGGVLVGALGGSVGAATSFSSVPITI